MTSARSRLFRRTGRFGRATVVAIAIALLATACGGSSGGSTSTGGRLSITYAAFDGVTGLTAKFGQKKGFFRKAGLDVTFAKADDPVALTASGDVDVADSDTTSALIGAGKGAPIRIVSSMWRTKGPFYLLADKGIRRIEDLRGKRVGIGRKGSGMEVYTRVILAKHGLTDKDVTLVPDGAYQSAYASLRSHQVEATIIHEPFVSLAEAKGTGHLLAKGWDYLPTFHTGVEIANKQFVERNPEALKRFLAVYFEASTYAKEHPGEYKGFAARQTGVPVEVETRALERENPIWDNDPRLDLVRLRQTEELQRSLGFQDTVYDPKTLVDTSFLPKGYPKRSTAAGVSGAAR